MLAFLWKSGQELLLMRTVDTMTLWTTRTERTDPGSQLPSHLSSLDHSNFGRAELHKSLGWVGGKQMDPEMEKNLMPHPLFLLQVSQPGLKGNFIRMRVWSFTITLDKPSCMLIRLMDFLVPTKISAKG